MGRGWRARAGFLCHRWLLRGLRGDKADTGAVDSKIGVGKCGIYGQEPFKKRDDFVVCDAASKREPL